jgi:hypothetical protein
MHDFWNRFAVGWCRVFHSRTSWPIRGHYHCASCLRIYPVPWEEGAEFLRQTSERTLSGYGHHGFVVFEFQKDRG